MSASDTNSSIYMTDKPNEIKNKMNKHAFSGGQALAEDHRKYGGNPDVDVSYQYLGFLMDDDDEYKKIAEVSIESDRVYSTHLVIRNIVPVTYSQVK